MTESQLRFQTLKENQRHNMEVERYEATKAKSSARQADVAERNVAVSEYLKKPQAFSLYANAIPSLFKPAEMFSNTFKNMVGGGNSLASLFA